MIGYACYACSACSRTFCWWCDQPVSADLEIKSVGSRYCEALPCRIAEARAHGLSLEVMAEHRERWRRARVLAKCECLPIIFRPATLPV